MTSQQGTTPPPGKEAPASADQIRRTLQQRRERSAAKADDRMARFRAKADREKAVRAIRQGLTRDRTAATLSRAKAAADIAQSAEARALRVQRTRTLTLAVLLPVLFAFGAWSTAGVHAGVTVMIGIDSTAFMWWMLWALEPALITAVGWIILSRSRLETSGGALPEEAEPIMWGCLTVSVVLNTVGHWPAPFDWQGAGALLAHSLGPIGAATTAHLIGVIEKGITNAKPTEGEGVKTLAELTDDHNDNTADNTQPEHAEPVSEPDTVDRSRAPERALDVPAGAHQLAVVQCCQPAPATPSRKPADTPSENTRRSDADQDGKQGSQTPSKARSDKGRTLPKSATPAARQTPTRALSDSDLVDRMDALIASGQVPATVSVRRAMTVLGCGYDRAKRVLAAREERTETTVADHLSVVGESTKENAA